MARYAFDLHIHSSLSPCAENTSTPVNMAGLFALSGYKILALTDHNSCGNCRPFIKACEKYGVLGIPGMELNTSEEVHVLCLFKKLEDAERFSKLVYDSLPDVKNRSDIFGDQLYMDEFDNVTAAEEKLLIQASSIGIYDVKPLVESFGGTAFPAHIDRQSNSLLNNLGLWDPAMGFELAELSAGCPIGFAQSRKDLLGLRTIRGTDAHRLEQIPVEPGQFMEIESLSTDCVFDWLTGKSNT